MIQARKKRLLCIAAALCLCSCGSRIGTVDSVPDIVQQSEPVQTTAPEGEEAPAEVTSVEEIKVVPEAVVYKKYNVTAEAEGGKLSGKAKKAVKREGYSGEGYVSPINTASSCALSFELPETQFYNITVTAAAAKNASGTVSAAGNVIGEFTVEPADGFSLMTFSNVRLEKGTLEITVAASAGSFDLDSVTVAASTEIKNLKLALPALSLTNKEASAEARALYKYICEGYGSRILTGQHDTCGTLAETRRVYELTGRYPAIRGGDLMPFTRDMMIGENEISYAIEWAEDGGLVSYMWHWTDPLGNSTSCYADEVDFDLTAAVTKEDIALLAPEEIEKLHADGKISDECSALIQDIDKISQKLAELRDAGIPVLWRPLHEASNGYFWWGRDAAAYKWLWKLLYTRQTQYHKLDNLIWVWSAQNADWYVGDNLCDMISCDIYDKGNTSGQADKLLFLQNISAKKPAVISECGNLPAISRAAGENAMWGYIMQWGEHFLLNDDGSLNEEYNTLEGLIEFYNNDLTITREELPSISELAEEIKKADEEAEEAKKAAEEKKKAEEEKKKKEEAEASEAEE